MGLKSYFKYNFLKNIIKKTIVRTCLMKNNNSLGYKFSNETDTSSSKEPRAGLVITGLFAIFLSPVLFFYHLISLFQLPFNQFALITYPPFFLL